MHVKRGKKGAEWGEKQATNEQIRKGVKVSRKVESLQVNENFRTTEDIMEILKKKIPNV